eukprot:scaffold34946_cov153-Amphora_coffeaeformis.AAC.3
MPRFQFVDDDSSDSDGDDPQHDNHSRSNHSATSSSDVETENEPPHPLGFPTYPKATAWGQSRYALDWSDDEDEWLERKVTQPTRKYPPISSYLRTGDNSTPMKTLIKDTFLEAAKKKDYDEEEADDAEEDDDLMDAMQAIVLSKPSSTALVPHTAIPPPNLTYYSSLRQKEQDCRDFSQKYESKIDRDNQMLRNNLKSYITQQQKEADRLREENEKQQREEVARVEEAARQKEADRIRQEEKDKEKEAEDNRKAEIKAAEDAKLQGEKDAQAQRLADAQKKIREESQYVERAQKYVSALEKVRESIAPFDTSKPMAKRRLAMKKIVNGRVNTLSEDVSKIQAVAQDVNNAIAVARQDDTAIKAQVEAGNAEYQKEMALGKRYFLDLLSSKVVVRVQAEGFNGQRGDGFPLAHMLAIVGKHNPDFKYSIEPHIHKVCPTAIPYLPSPSASASEDELMESLGMLKGSDGNFETFERFLNRTEGIISMVADIMASTPADHGLFGGSEGAVKWLERFLKQLPKPPHSPLPLLTAPVLDAFLTGAGHMLANCYPAEFEKILKEIDEKVIPRLDEGSIGMPSVIRLKKTTEGGFSQFRAKLPPKALEALYHGANGRTDGQAATQPPAQSSAPNPFGVGGSSTAPTSSNPFGNNSGQRATQSSAPNPFGMGSSTTPAAPFGNAPGPAGMNSSPFGTNTSSSGNQREPNLNSAFSQATNATLAASPFGTTAPLNSAFSGMQTSAPASSNAMNTRNAPAPSPFGSSQSPFGASAPGPSPFGSSPSQLGANAPGPSPFGGAAPSPFGGQSSAPSTFGGTAPGPSPFGGGSAAGAPTPFGGGAPAPAPFGMNASAPTPFGSTGFGAAAPAPTPFGGGAPAPTPFGNTGFGVAVPGPSPFGAAAPAPTPFGSTASPFGTSGPAPGGAFGAPAPGPSPFGAPGPTPFGGASGFGAPTPFGTFSNAPAPTPFSGNNNNQQGGGFGGSGNNTRICKYFAKGNCHFGSNCRYSHDIQPSSTSFSSPFGGPRR